MFCFKCGKELVDGAAFCQHCGSNVAKPTPPAPPTVAPPPQAPYVPNVYAPQSVYVAPPAAPQPVYNPQTVYVPQQVYTQPVVQPQIIVQPVVQPIVEEVKPREPGQAEHFLSAFFSKTLFLVATIFASIYAALIAITGFESGDIDEVATCAITILAVISMWILYSLAKRTALIDKYVKPLGLMRAAALINYILGWVNVGIYAIAGMFMVAFPELFVGGYDESGIFDVSLEFNSLADTYTFVGIAAVLFAVGHVFLNIFVNGKLSKFMKTVVAKAKEGKVYAKGLKGIKIRLIVLAGATAIIAIINSVMDYGIAYSDYVLGDYYIESIIGILSYIVPSLVLATAFVLLAFSLKVPKLVKVEAPSAEEPEQIDAVPVAVEEPAEVEIQPEIVAVNENIVDNSENNDIIDV